MAELTHKTISKGRKTIVFGMPWYTVEEEESPRKAGVSFAREIPAPYDLLVVRKGEAPQFALASTTEGAKTGAISAASIVAEIVQTDSWLYVLEIESSIWICCGRDGLILPAGDRIYENRDEARRAFQALNPSSFKKVYLPESWKQTSNERDDLADVASDTEETDILEFIEYTPPKWGKLTSVSPLGLILQFGSLAVLLALAFMVANYIMTNTVDNSSGGPTPEDIQKVRDELRRQQAAERDARWAALDADRPWHREAKALSTFDQCLSGIRSIPAHPIGYDVLQVYCDGRTVEAEVQRTTGYTSWLREWAQTYEDLTVSMSSNGDNGYIVQSVPAMDDRGAQELSHFEEVTDTLLDKGQIEGASVNVTTPAAAIVQSEPDYTPYYAVSNFKIETRRPEAWRPFFSETPGFAIGEINFNLENKTYAIQGDLYVKNLNR